MNNKKCNKNKVLPSPTSNQKGSLILEAIIVLGMIATFTPMLYKHVADRRADLENINRANTLLYLQHKAEDYLKDPDNVTALVNELGHNQHKEIFPSEMGAGSNFDGRYIVGIRREDENNKPVLKAMIIDTVHTGSDLRAAKVAELIGLSAGIYTAVDPEAAWGINGFWSEPLSRYFDTTDIPTGAVAITTEYNKAKYRVNISDILVDADLDMGEFEVTAEQINAVAIAAKNGTLEQLIASDKITSAKVVATKKLCVGGEEDENCIESWEGLGGDGEGQKSDLQLVQECNVGMTESCTRAFAKDLNTSCSKVDAVYDQAGATPDSKIYALTYGNGAQYTGTVRTKCEGTSFIVDNISTSTFTNPVEQVGDTAFGITTPGWYQVTLMGEVGASPDTDVGSGGVLIANKNFSADALLILKGVQGSVYSSTSFGGAGVLLWDDIIDTTTNPPTLGAGGGRGNGSTGGGIVGGSTNRSDFQPGYGWNGSLGGNTTTCSDTACGSADSSGGAWYSGGNYAYGGSGSSQSECSAAGYSSCVTTMGGNTTNSSSPYVSYLNSKYGNWRTNTLTEGKGYASIIYCGTSEADCPIACMMDADCPSDIPYCDSGACTDTKACTASSECAAASLPYCVENLCSDTCTADSQCPTATPYCENGLCATTKSCSANSNCPSGAPYCISNICSATPPAGTVMYRPSSNGSYTIPAAGRYKIQVTGGTGGGSYTATVYYNKGVSLTAHFLGGCHLSGGSATIGGTGVALLVGGSPVLVAGGGGNLGGSGGGYYGGCYCNGRYGTSNWSCSRCGASVVEVGTRCSSETSGAGTGKYYYNYKNGTTTYFYGGSGYCASGYSCSGSYGGSSSASLTVTYCGPSSSSTCP